MNTTGRCTVLTLARVSLLLAGALWAANSWALDVTIPPDIAIEAAASTDPTNTGVLVVTRFCGRGYDLFYEDRGPEESDATIYRSWSIRDQCDNALVVTQRIVILPALTPLQLIGVPFNTTVECGAVPPPPTVFASGGCSTGAPAGQLLLHYTFDTPFTQTVFDVSGFGQHGQNTGALHTLAGYIGGAALFDGSGYIRIPNVQGVNGATALTFSAWVRPVASGSLGVMGKTRSLDETAGLVITPQSGYVAGSVRSTQRYLVSDGFPGITTGVWNHIAGVYNGHSFIVYWNGQPMSIATNSGIFPVHSNNVTMTVGDFGEGMGWMFKGHIDEVRIYGRPLSPAEIGALAAGHQATSVQFVESTNGACPGTITRVWTATDACGNSVSATQTITVLAAPQPPPPLQLIGVPSNITVECGAIPEPPAVSASGGCSSTGSTDGLVAYFPFDSSGPLIDASGSGRTSLVVGATWIPGGRIGGAYRFNGAQQFIRLSDEFLPVGDAPRTFAMWVSTDNLHTNGGSDFFSYGARAPNQYNLVGIDWREERNQFSFTQWGAVVQSTSRVTSVSNWYHIAYVYRGTNDHRWYVNGIGQAGLVETYVPLDTQLDFWFYLGGHDVSEHPFVGMLDEVRVYNRALAESEVQSLADLQSSGSINVAFHQSGTSACPGTITRVWTATDSCGTSVSATQTITVLAAAEPLSLVGVPDDITVECGAVPPAPDVTATGGCNSSSSTTTNGWLPVLNPENGHYYYLAPGALSWPQARTAANVIYGGATGHLATISNFVENAFLLSLIPTNASAVWVGATDEGQEGTWQWLTGEPLVYTNWGSGEPSSGTIENYLALLRISAIPGQWNDVGTGARPGYIDYFLVEWENANPVAPAVTISENSEGDCPGTITRVWTATDACGNSVSATQTITVLAASQPPPPLQLIGVPSNITVECGAIPEPPAVSASGGCSSTGSTDGLVAYFPFDSSGPLIDASGGGRTTLHNNATWIPDGRVGGAYAFTGSNSFVLVSDDNLPHGDSPRTIAMWVSVDQLQTNGGTDFLSYGIPTPNHHVLLGVDWRVGRSQFAFSPWGSVVLSTGKVTAASNWRHIAYVYQGSNQHQWFVDGVGQLGDRETTGPMDTLLSGVLQLGAQTVSEHKFGGRLDDVRIYNRALTESEVQALASGGRDPKVAFKQIQIGSCPATVTRVWTATDACGNSVSATQVIQVVQQAGPRITGMDLDDKGLSIKTTGTVSPDQMRIQESFDLHQWSDAETIGTLDDKRLLQSSDRTATSLFFRAVIQP